MDMKVQNLDIITQPLLQPNKAMDQTRQEVWKSSQKFEGFFVGFIFDQIHENIDRSELWGDSQSTQVFESMFMQKVSEQASNGPKGGLGIAQQLYQQFDKRFGNNTVNIHDNVQGEQRVSEKV